MEQHATRISRISRTNATVHRPLSADTAKPVCSHITCLL